MGRKRTNPQYIYAVVDDAGIYATTLHMKRSHAEEEVQEWRDLRDAKWRIVKVLVERGWL